LATSIFFKKEDHLFSYRPRCSKLFRSP